MASNKDESLPNCGFIPALLRQSRVELWPVHLWTSHYSHSTLLRQGCNQLMDFLRLVDFEEFTRVCRLQLQDRLQGLRDFQVADRCCPSKPKTLSDRTHGSRCFGRSGVAACLVRTPTEIVKQRMQTGIYMSLSESLNAISATEGLRGFYRGYWSMIAREIPFSFVQFPLWEGLKHQWSKNQNNPVSSLQGAICGSLAGGVAASITTPLDVVKTRLMLGKDAHGVPYNGTVGTLSRISRDEGLKRLFSGVGPRTMWISIGGFVFFGMYEKTTSTFASII
ncbi:hypothetical protein PsorP6_002686 [Peronosclerospora sorghi]|uniref:Uncharacterized protein n=1 Tax=Peronosclerospora sorghi TaxID=230839 RepID=A0ACC0WWX1_9STRA|nr:hypothetical protein PsorP6_002686 [Peronosclerospora sorghi]